jgi:hypothetical protein
MLDKLDDVPWRELHHAYGTADDVPGLLRALAKSDDRQNEALYELFGNIWHQGTVYEASAYAVPFLVELAATTRLTRRDEILGLIGALADGRSYLDVHGGPDQFVGKQLRQQSGFEERMKRELENVNLTRAAVLGHQREVLQLLSDATPMVRAGAAYVLSRFPEAKAEFGPAVIHAAAFEIEDLPRAGMLWCIGAMGDESPEAISLLETVLHKNSDPRQTFAAAIALHQVTEQIDRAVGPVFRCMAAANWFADGFLSGVPWDCSIGAELDEYLAEFEPDTLGATAMLLRLLSEPAVGAYTMTLIVHDLLQMNFVDGDWRSACSGWNETQRNVVRRVIATDTAWIDAKRLWFLVPDGAKRISSLMDDEICSVRNEMAAALSYHGG